MSSSKHGSVSASEKSPEKKLSINASDNLSNLKVRVNNKLIVGNLNINSIAGKFDQLKLMVQHKVDILILTETKIGSSFLNQQFHIEGFCRPYRLNRNKHGGGVLVYIREDIPSKILKNTFLSDDIEGIFIELNLRKHKWLLCATYHPPNQKDDYFFNHMGKAIDVYHQTYDKFFLIGDFNAEDTEPWFLQFLFEYDAKNIVSEKPCFKSKDNPSCIDLFNTNSPNSFQNTSTITAGVSDFHKMVITVSKATFTKSKPKVIIYRDFKLFNEEKFKTDLKNSLRITNISSYYVFQKIFLKVLERHDPIKNKTIRANHAPYVTKTMRKPILKRTELQHR